MGRRVLSVVTVWGFAVLLAAYAGLFEPLAGPVFGLVVIAGIAVPLLLIARIPALRRWAIGLPLASLTLLHVWRVPAALVFWAHADALPEVFVRNAAYGDFVVGCLAPLVVLMAESRAKWIVFHVLGAADFVVAVGTGLTLTFLEDPQMSAITTYPLVLIPAFGVCLSGISHAIAFAVLLRGAPSRDAATA